ncbi:MULTISPECIES: MFS transporter [Pseudoalteromonas]|uniref:MFS transporter n=1 Tax=Pseudoalteromonas distincta TaxID=77608 RepID=A0A4P9J620_9GAMM|nr:MULTISPECIES: MFS transporter [Pseudoalteromonas]KAA1154397.1 MFS transporter [Pseudoalteromonas distincta]KHM45462.1 galactoside permease [Pseudoalteromonas elyakovii]KID40110.1 galactoside permease [Pseudoalteromonas distincta]MBH0066813.1 MFS transporter [Pseudoalteromonas sp. NZS100]MDP4485840.1 MFS transporter [Pseudoalteromonas elyakovii]|tara:strand:- start:10758 stop:12011 length:1254 start_codon:yes stop_codon:yes gene_type:complete
MTEHLSKRNYWLLSGCILSFFLTWSFCFSIYPIWLNQAIGLNGTQTGIVFSINAIAALFVMPCYGFIQDKLGLKKNLLWFVGVMLLLSGPFFIYVYTPLLISSLYVGAFAGGLFCSVAFFAGVGAVETYIERVGRNTGFEFGKARMWGSVGWAIATFFTGQIFNISPTLNFVLASVSALVFLVCLWFVKASDESKEVNLSASALKITDAIALFKDAKFWAFTTFVIGVSCIYGVYDQQFPVYFAAQFPTREEGNAMYGYLNSFQVFLEAGGMFLAPFLVNKIGAKNGLIVSGVVMALRIIGSGYATDPLSISAMKLLHAVELPIMLIAIFKYISATFDARLSATIYIVGFQFMGQVAASGLSVFTGILYDAIGFAEAYKLIGIVVAFFVVVSAFVLTSDKNSNQVNSKEKLNPQGSL